MSKLQGKIILFLLIAAFCAVIFRFVGNGQSINLENANRHSRRFAFLIVPLITCYLLLRRYLFVRQYNLLPGFKSTLGLNGFLSAIYSNARRGLNVSIAGSEFISSLPMLSLEGDKQDIYGGFLGPLPIAVVISPDTIRQILHHPLTQRKGPSYDIIRSSLGDGLVTASSTRWAAHRKLLTPAFHFKILESLMSIVIPSTEELISRLEQEAASKSDRSIDDLTPYILDTGLKTLSQSSMGIDLQQLSASDVYVFECLSRALDMFIVRVVTPWMQIEPIFAITKFGREYNGYRRSMKSFSEKVIGKRMTLLKQRTFGSVTSAEEEEMGFSSKVREPFMDIMIHEHLEDPKSFSIADIRDETNIFAIAGRDTTALSIMYTLLLLGHHPDVQEKLFQELEEYFSENTFDQLTPELIKQFTYLDAVYKESLRLYTPIPLITRLAEGDININDRVIPKGTEIMLALSMMHRSARYWPDPHRFKPERFLSPLSDPFIFMPFVAGPRNCIGQKYARIQAKSIIIALVCKYRIESVTHLDEVTTFLAPVLHTPTPIKLRLHPRESAK